MGRAAILGTGLIGASLGMALRQAGWTVAGWDPDRSAQEGAAARGATDLSCATREDAVSGAGLVVLAGPLSATLETLAGLRTDALVTDVAGVKVPVVRAKPPHLRLVAGHPMAGREQAGPSAATPAMFRGAAWIICPDGAAVDDVEILAGIVEDIGAIPYTMPAAEHDRVVAAISHLPQVIAVSLVNLASRDPGAMQLVAGSFRDLTRVAASEPGMVARVAGCQRDQRERGDSRDDRPTRRDQERDTHRSRFPGHPNRVGPDPAAGNGVPRRSGSAWCSRTGRARSPP